MSEISRPEEPSAPTRGRVRLTSVAGAVASACLVLALFLDWVVVEPPLAQQFRADVTKALDDAEATSAARDDLRRLADTLAERHGLAGTDFILWVRSARAYTAERAAERPVADPVDQQTQRRLHLARILLYALPLAGFVLAAYFLVHRLRRARSPMLILCALTGALGILVAGGFDFVHHVLIATLGQAAVGVQLALGVWLMLGAGAVLLLVGLFGVTKKNWFRVYAGSAATAVCLALIASQYVQKGLAL